MHCVLMIQCQTFVAFESLIKLRYAYEPYTFIGTEEIKKSSCTISIFNVTDTFKSVMSVTESSI